MSHQSKFCFLFFKSKKIPEIFVVLYLDNKTKGLFLVLIPFMAVGINLVLSRESPVFFFVSKIDLSSRKKGGISVGKTGKEGGGFFFANSHKENELGL